MVSLLKRLWVASIALSTLSKVAISGERINYEMVDAAEKGQASRVQELLEAKADPNGREDLVGWTALRLAARNNNIEVVRLLLNSKADPNLTADQSASVLMTTCQYGHDSKDIAELLLNYGAEINHISDKRRETVLDVAIKCNKPEITKFLLYRGAITSFGDTDLITACRKCDMKTLDLLLNNFDHVRSRINQRSGRGDTALTVAVGQNDHYAQQLTKKLLESKADPNKKERITLYRLGGTERLRSYSPLELAIHRSNAGTVNILLHGGSVISKFCLYSAIKTKSLETIRALLEAKADPNAFFAQKTSLITACQIEDEKIVNILLQNRANPNLFQSNGKTPLFVVIKKNNKELVRVLLDSKANPNLTHTYPTLIEACKVKNPEIVKMLLESGATPFCVSDRKETCFSVIKLGFNKEELSFYNLLKNLSETESPEEAEKKLDVFTRTKKADDSKNLEIIHNLIVEARRNKISTITHIDEKEVCSICLDEFDENEDNSIMVIMSCKHKFHTICIETWRGIRNDCPLCRKNMVNPTTTTKLQESIEKDNDLNINTFLL